MSSFTQDLKVKVLDSGANYEVLEPFEYYLADNKEAKIIVEQGFITDFATIPRIFWSIYPPFGRYTKSAVLHDRLCVAVHNKEDWQEVMQGVKLKQGKVKRSEADKIFLESMKEIGVSVVTRNILYAGVRIYAIVKGIK